MANKNKFNFDPQNESDWEDASDSQSGSYDEDEAASGDSRSSKSRGSSKKSSQKKKSLKI